ncbi:MAG: ABC transporter permease [Alphaproteobacteria bacterium]|nr:MAG: ABC transporter permease [Alphaproteobacteria bacterium]
MEALIIQALTGLASASSLFLVASGLSLIFGVTRIVNFAHGSFYMLGAYLAVSLLALLPRGDPMWWWLGVLGAALAVGVIGTVLEMVLLRRIYRAPELFQLLATFGVVLIVQDLVLLIWGPQDILGPRAPGLRFSIEILGQPFPVYDLVLITIGPVVLAGLWALVRHTRFGMLVRAATHDRETVAALGVDQRLLFTAVFALGSTLAGLGGALQLPREAVTSHMDLAIIAEVFVVVVVGGLGSVPGAYLAALLIGQVHAFGILVLPEITLVLIFLVMAAVLVVRPHGLLGRPLAHARGGEAVAVLRAAGPRVRQIAWVALTAAILLPLAGSQHVVTLATEAAVFILFAASLHLLLGPAGLVSFGHAGLFGVGAYAVALAVKHWAAPMAVGLALAPFAAGLAGAAFGVMCAHLSGVYLAMLSLAFAQILWSAAFQWVALTGGDNGILGVRAAGWEGGGLAFYYLTLTLCLGGMLVLRRAILAPWGYGLRAGRDAPLRAAALGIPVVRLQWAAFAIAGAAAGMAGGLFAYAKGSVFPTYLAIPKSVDGLLMVLLGGIHTLSGPLVGALVFVGLEDVLTRATDLWRMALGLIILGVVLVFPQGVVGAVSRRTRDA